MRTEVALTGLIDAGDLRPLACRDLHNIATRTECFCLLQQGNSSKGPKAVDPDAPEENGLTPIGCC